MSTALNVLSGITTIGIFICFCALIYTACSVIKNRHKLQALEEQEVRRQWLNSFIWFVLFNFMTFIAQLPSIAGQISDLELFLTVCVICLFTTLWFGAIYHFSYKKNGTTWLKIAIITSVPYRLSSVLNFDMEISTLIGAAIPIGFIFLFIYCSIYLYKVNARIRDAKLPKIRLP